MNFLRRILRIMCTGKSKLNISFICANLGSVLNFQIKLYIRCLVTVNTHRVTRRHILACKDSFRKFKNIAVIRFYQHDNIARINRIFPACQTHWNNHMFRFTGSHLKICRSTNRRYNNLIPLRRLHHLPAGKAGKHHRQYQKQC